MGTPHPETPTGHETSSPGSQKHENKTDKRKIQFPVDLCCQKTFPIAPKLGLYQKIENIVKKSIFRFSTKTSRNICRDSAKKSWELS